MDNNLNGVFKIKDFRNDHKTDNKKNEVIKISDFSIDHILNRAGNNQCERLNNKVTENYHEFNNSSNNDHIRPTFDWLQYTRYRPPKIPRPLRAGPVKRTPGRLPRVPFTPAQLSALEDAYRESTYLSSEEANTLAMKLDLTNTRVKIWFQNRRARERREKRDQVRFSPTSSPSPERGDTVMTCFKMY